VRRRRYRLGAPICPASARSADLPGIYPGPLDTRRTASTLHPDKRMKAPRTIQAAERLGSLSEPVRLRVLALLATEELSVGEVAKILQLPQSTVSRHLKALAEAGWVEKRAAGTATLYSMEPDELEEAARALWAPVQRSLEGSREIAEDRERLAAVLAERPADSQAYFGRIGGEWAQVRRELFGDRFTLEALAGLVPPEWVVADLGCGTGDVAAVLGPLVERVVAVDLSSAMLEAAKGRLAGCPSVEFVEGSLESLPLEDGSVDAAVCSLGHAGAGRAGAQRDPAGRARDAGADGLREEYGASKPLGPPEDHGLAAHDRADGGADRDARRSGGRRPLGSCNIFSTQDSGRRGGRWSGRDGTPENPQGRPGVRLEGRDARGVLVVHRSRRSLGRTARARTRSSTTAATPRCWCTRGRVRAAGKVPDFDPELTPRSGSGPHTPGAISQPTRPGSQGGRRLIRA
jgi:DNA-binding transcriptional ArsR family regulator